MDLLTYTTLPGKSASELAKAIGVSPVLILQWRSNSRSIPLPRCPAIERATDGAVTCKEMRADVTWRRVPDRKWPHKEGRPVVDFCSEAA